MNNLDLNTAVILSHQANSEYEEQSLLTLKERYQISEINRKNHYGISQTALKNLIRKHKAARNENDLHEMEAIEYRLTDINFHSECGLICKGQYKEALDMVNNNW